MKKIIYLIFLFSFLISCNEQILIDVYKRVNVKFKVNTDSKTKYDSISYFFYNSSGVTLPKTTFEDNMDIDLFPGAYSITVKAYTGGLYFTQNSTLLVFNDSKNYFEFNPLLNTGTISIKCENKMGENLSNINVALLTKYPKDNYLFYESMNLVYKSGKTDQNGIITFNDVPNEYRFGIIYYIDDKLYYYDRTSSYRTTSYLYVEKFSW